MDRHAIGLVPPSPRRKPHPANGMTAEVHAGDGAYLTIVNPTHDTGLEWVMRYGVTETVRYSAASVIATFDHLLSDGCTMAEATRRLRLLRQARAALAAKPTDERRDT